MEAKSVTVTLSHRNKNVFENGQLIKIKRVYKRIWGKVIASYSGGCTIKAVYRPSPKSNLNNKSFLSKHKGEIILLKTKTN